VVNVVEIVCRCFILDVISDEVVLDLVVCELSVEVPEMNDPIGTARTESKSWTICSVSQTNSRWIAGRKM